MKLRDLERHLRAHGCERQREGANHTIWINRTTQKRTAVGRHTEIETKIARDICDQLGIPRPTKK